MEPNTLLYDVVIYHKTNRIIESILGKAMHLDKGFSNAEKRLETVELRINENYSAEIVPSGKYKIGDSFCKLKGGTTMKLALAQRLKKLRKRSTFSMAEVARRAIAADKCGKGHITQGYISRLEAGKETNPSLAKVLMLCRIYKTDPNMICGWKGALK